MKKVFVVTAIIYSGDGNSLSQRVEQCGIFSTMEKAERGKKSVENDYYRANIIIEEIELDPEI
jgi:hypothetical protein